MYYRAFHCKIACRLSCTLLCVCLLFYMYCIVRNQMVGWYSHLKKKIIYRYRNFNILSVSTYLNLHMQRENVLIIICFIIYFFFRSYLTFHIAIVQLITIFNPLLSSIINSNAIHNIYIFFFRPPFPRL